MSATLASIKSQLIPLNDVIIKLKETEPLASHVIDASTTTSFRLDSDWAEEAKSADMTDAVGAYITIDGQEYQFSKEGILQAASTVGLRTTYALKTPVKFIEDQLNYWFNSGLGESVHKIVVVKDRASAFVRPTIVPFSNIDLVESIVSGINEYYGKDIEILADFKMYNSLNRTDVRLVIPSALHVMKGTNMLDVPDGQVDVWSRGVNLTNSLTGKSKTAIDSYLFRWWATNGAIRETDDVGTWNRKQDGQVEDTVYEWAQSATQAVLSTISSTLEQVQALSNIKLKGATVDVLKKVFTDHKIPVTQQNHIQKELIEANDVNMYSLMSALTAQANDSTLIPERVDKLLRIGGGLVDHYYDDSKAKIFEQGQQAGPTAVNPYLVKVD